MMAGGGNLDLLFTGDLVLDAPDPDHWLSGLAPLTRAAGCSIGHLEVPHTRRGVELGADVPAPAADPAHLAALARSGFAAVTLAGNHIADCGAEGIIDTRAQLERLGLHCCGAGTDLAQARAPALLRAGGRRVALLSYNCVGPEQGWAGTRRAGCAYVRIETADGGPIAPAAALSQADPASIAELARDVRDAAQAADVVVVALHKGIVHTPALLAPYERPVAHAAIDAGADIVVSHHAHIIRGIEFYRGRPIYHGLGNGCVVTRALSPDQSHPARAEWARRREQLFGFKPDPAYTLAPFHPEAVNGLLARIQQGDDGRWQCGFVPVFVEPPGRPVIADAQQSEHIIDYVATITARAGLPALRFERTGAMVRLT